MLQSPIETITALVNKDALTLAAEILLARVTELPIEETCQTLPEDALRKLVETLPASPEVRPGLVIWSF